MATRETQVGAEVAVDGGSRLRESQVFAEVAYVVTSALIETQVFVEVAVPDTDFSPVASGSARGQMLLAAL